MAKKKTNLLWIILVIVAILILKKGMLFAEVGFETVTRSFDHDPTYIGDIATVSLDVDPSSTTKSVLIHEEAPVGWIITGLTDNIYETALLDQIQVQPITKTYQLDTTGKSAGNYGFTGIFTINGGADQTIIGDTSLQLVSCTSSSEICDGLDNNCDYLTDNIAPQLCPLGGVVGSVCEGITQACVGGSWETCDYGSNYGPEINFGCDGLDNDCDGNVELQKTLADTNCDNIVDWDEINDYVTLWIAGSATWTQINQAVAAWIGG